MNLIPLTIPWCILALAVVGLFIWRKAVARNEDDTLHVLDGGAVQQAMLNNKLQTIDKWGKITTIVVVIYGSVLAALFIYQSWVQNSTVGV